MKQKSCGREINGKNKGMNGQTDRRMDGEGGGVHACACVCDVLIMWIVKLQNYRCYFITYNNKRFFNHPLISCKVTLELWQHHPPSTSRARVVHDEDNKEIIGQKPT